MSSSTPNLKFLLDENVRIELFRFLKEKGFDVKLAPKSTTDQKLASISKTERRILVTNDEDFADYTRDQIFAVVWLRIPQDDSESLTGSFERMLKEVKHFSAKLVVLREKKFEELPFPSSEQLKKTS